MGHLTAGQRKHIMDWYKSTDKHGPMYDEFLQKMKDSAKQMWPMFQLNGWTWAMGIDESRTPTETEIAKELVGMCRSVALHLWEEKRETSFISTGRIFIYVALFKVRGIDWRLHFEVCLHMDTIREEG